MKIILMGTPHHANIGDLAIAYAEEKIIKELFPQKKFYIMQEEKLDTCAKKVKKYIKDDDIILLHGGGNIGDTYVTPEMGRREVISSYPNNKIIIFPQTAYFENEEELNISKKIYNAHNDLVIMAREKKSYEFMKKNFYNAKVCLTPDIVMSLKESSNTRRHGVLLMFRRDKEKILGNNMTDFIVSYVEKNFESYKISDMNIGTEPVNNISEKIRENILKDKFEELQNAKLVITDRLHGMIFSAITETPCVVFDSLTHKIIESYDWFKNLGYIQMCKNINNLENCIKKAINFKPCIYDNDFTKKIISNILIDEIGDESQYV